MAGTYTQIYIQYVFAVKGRNNLLQQAFQGELPGGEDIEFSRNTKATTKKSRRDDKIIEKMTNQ